MICILKAKVSFIGLTNYEYYVCSIINNTFSVEKVERKKAKSIIDKNNLQVEFSSKDGKVYSDGKFKDYCNKNLVAKYIIQKMIDSADLEVNEKITKS